MLEQRINILDQRVLSKADAICFTSNGVIRKNGCLVMGAGVAKAFRDRFVGIDRAAGRQVQRNGNICQVIPTLTDSIPEIVAFPTKHDWRDPSDIDLIEKSARELMELIEKKGWARTALPRPGCNNGSLNWKEVKKVIEPILDDRVVIVYL